VSAVSSARELSRTVRELDERWMAAALALASRAVGLSSPNPPVGCVIVRDGLVVGRGWTQAGGRPHAEEMALRQAGERAAGSTVYVTLEPCNHQSTRGPACSEGLTGAGVARVVVCCLDPDPRTNGSGVERLRSAGIAVDVGLLKARGREVAAGFFSRVERGRPHVTLKIAMSLDGCIAMADGRSRWITNEVARAHSHLERSRADVIIVGSGTLDADNPTLDVRLPGLEHRSPRAAILSRSLGRIPPTRKLAQRGGVVIHAPDGFDGDPGVLRMLVEGGMGAATSFLKAERVDRLLIYRAPIIIGRGRPAIGDIGLTNLQQAHGRWHLEDARSFGSNRLEVYVRQR
jgi:diaminohydroxyphosphoribosylaminopyrimidine deaminase/5-amino-6-(5-phosphoribosylamino)uracil reductase